MGSITFTPGTAEQLANPGTSYSTTHAFSPGAGTTVAVMCSWIAASGGSTFTCKDSNGVSYTQQVHTNNTSTVANSFIYTNTYASAPGSITLVLTSTVSASRIFVVPVTVTGMAGSQTGAATLVNSGTASTSTIQGSVTTTQKGSYVLLSGAAGATSSSVPAVSGTSSFGASGGTTIPTEAGGRTTSATSTPGTVTVGWTVSPNSSSGFTIAGLEILAPASGSFAVTLPALTSGINGSTTEFGSFAVTLPAPAAGFSGCKTESGSFAVTVPAPQSSGSGSVTEFGTFAVTLPVAATSVAGVNEAGQGQFSVNLPAFTAGISAGFTWEGPFAVTVTRLQSTASGISQQTRAGTFAVTLPVPVWAGNGTERYGNFRAVLPPLASAVSGSTTKGAFSVTLPVLACAVTGVPGHTGSFGTELPVIASDFEGNTVESGPFGPLLANPSVSFTGTVQHSVAGVFHVILPVPATKISGTYIGAQLHGRFMIELPIGYRTEASGTPGVILPVLATGITASNGYSGPLSIFVPMAAAGISAVAQQTTAGTFTVFLPQLRISVTGKHMFFVYGSLVIRMPVPDSAVSGVTGHVGPFVLDLQFP